MPYRAEMFEQGYLTLVWTADMQMHEWCWVSEGWWTLSENLLPSVVKFNLHVLQHTDTAWTASESLSQKLEWVGSSFFFYLFIS